MLAMDGKWTLAKHGSAGHKCALVSARGAIGCRVWLMLTRYRGRIMMIFLAAASLIAVYDCQLTAPKAVGFEAGQAAASTIDLPPASLHFSITLESGNPMQAKVDWPGDPLTMAGRFPTISTAPGAYAFLTYSPGPCLFTETSCLSQVNLVDAAGGTAKIIITPVALASDQSGTRAPFAVIALGHCVRADAKK